MSRLVILFFFGIVIIIGIINLIFGTLRFVRQGKIEGIGALQITLGGIIPIIIGWISLLSILNDSV